MATLVVGNSVPGKKSTAFDGATRLHFFPGLFEATPNQNVQ
jgi:hypothetical protein